MNIDEEGKAAADRRINERVVVYFHPWELDPEQPRIRDKWKSRVRHYTNLHKTERRLEILLENCSFQPFRKLVESQVAAEEPPVLEAARAHHE
jgi:hypothetical protein